MNKSNYLHILMISLMVCIVTSVYLFSDVHFSLQHTNVKIDFLFEGATEKTTVSSYYASDGEFLGGASIDINEDILLDQAILTLSDGSTINHQLTQKTPTHYVLNAQKKEVSSRPATLTLSANGEVYDVIDLTKQNGELYSFTDGDQSYRHIYINEAGVFLGEYYLEELSDDIKQNVILEFCHKDETKSGGYHVFAKKMISLSKFISGNDLGFVSFANGVNYDASQDVYVIISWSDTNIVEMPLVKGVN